MPLIGAAAALMRSGLTMLPERRAHTLTFKRPKVLRKNEAGQPVYDSEGEPVYDGGDEVMVRVHIYGASLNARAARGADTTEGELELIVLSTPNGARTMPAGIGAGAKSEPFTLLGQVGVIVLGAEPVTRITEVAEVVGEKWACRFVGQGV